MLLSLQIIDIFHSFRHMWKNNSFYSKIKPCTVIMQMIVMVAMYMYSFCPLFVQCTDISVRHLQCFVFKFAYSISIKDATVIILKNINIFSNTASKNAKVNIDNNLALLTVAYSCRIMVL